MRVADREGYPYPYRTLMRFNSGPATQYFSFQNGTSMANRVIQFPARNTLRPAPPETHGALARNSQEHAHRIAAQVEAELARKAERMATGLRVEFERVRNPNAAAATRWQRFRGLFSRAR